MTEHSMPKTSLKGFTWLNAPVDYELDGAALRLRTLGQTDFWQGTHYGFRRDNGHCFLKRVAGDFSFAVRTRFTPEAQYDQCGLFARVDAENWIKCSTEYETARLSRLGSVVTNLGYSDWASQDVAGAPTTMWYRMSRTGKDFLLEWSAEGEAWQQMRVTHLHAAGEAIDVGLYACSPVGQGFVCAFDQVALSASVWGEQPT